MRRAVAAPRCVPTALPNDAAAPRPALAVQRRHAQKVVSGSMKGKIMKMGRGGPLAKKYGWKIFPGDIAGVGYTIYKVKAYSAVCVNDDDDELPWSIYPGLNTIRDHMGGIVATCEGVVRVSKLPGTEGNGEKVFLWVDPHTRNYIEKEMRRGKHKEMGRDFCVDEVEDRTLTSPGWTDKGVDNREEELPEWPSNPAWDDEKDERDHSEAPARSPRVAKTEWEKYVESDNDMFWNQMPRRRRHYRFNGQTYEYEGARVEQKPLQPYDWQSYHWERPSVGFNRLHATRHDRDRGQKLRGVYQVSDMFGTSWN